LFRKSPARSKQTLIMPEAIGNGKGRNDGNDGNDGDDGAERRVTIRRKTEKTEPFSSGPNPSSNKVMIGDWLSGINVAGGPIFV